MSAHDAKQNTDKHMLSFGGQMFEPLSSGALFWPAQNALLVADLHLEKMSSFAKRGQLLPPYDTGRTLACLQKDLARTKASKLLALGDSFHRDEGTSTLLPKDRALLDDMIASVEWIWLSGNHDPSPHNIGGICATDLTIEGVKLTHEPEAGRHSVICGHLHPSARVAIKGRSQRSACFVADPRLLMLPAYGSSTGTLNILSAPFRGLLGYGKLQVFMLGRERVYPVSEQRLVS